MRSRAALGLLLACAACADDRNAIFIEVRSNLAVPTELARLSIIAESGGWKKELTAELGAGPGRISLPAKLGLEVASGKSGAPVRIHVSGRAGSAEIVSRTIGLPFWPSGRHTFEVSLDQECLVAGCRLGRTCVPGWGCVSPVVRTDGRPPEEPAGPSCDCNSLLPTCVGARWAYRSRSGPSSALTETGITEWGPVVEGVADPAAKRAVDAFVEVGGAGHSRRWFAREGGLHVLHREQLTDRLWAPRSDQYFVPYRLRLDESRTVMGDAWEQEYQEVVVAGDGSVMRTVRKDAWAVVPPPPSYPDSLPRPLCQRRTHPGARQSETVCFVRGLGVTHRLLEDGTEVTLTGHSIRGCSAQSWPAGADGPPVPPAFDAGAPQPVDVRPEVPDMAIGRAPDVPPDLVREVRPVVSPPPPPDGPRPPGLSPWQERVTAQRPPGRACAAVAYDAARDRMVLFGGGTTNQALLRDLWEWDPAEGRWANRTPTVLPRSWPPASPCPVATYDGRRNRVMVFPESITSWAWDGATGTWTQLVPASVTEPPPFTPALAYDEARDRVVGATTDGYGDDHVRGRRDDQSPERGPKQPSHHVGSSTPVRGNTPIFCNAMRGFRAP